MCHLDRVSSLLWCVTCNNNLQYIRENVHLTRTKVALKNYRRESEKWIFGLARPVLCVHSYEKKLFKCDVWGTFWGRGLYVPSTQLGSTCSGDRRNVVNIPWAVCGEWIESKVPLERSTAVAAIVQPHTRRTLFRKRERFESIYSISLFYLFNV